MTDISLFINAAVGVGITFILFLLKDIKDDIRGISKALMEHVSNQELHCSGDKFKLTHIMERG